MSESAEGTIPRMFVNGFSVNHIPLSATKTHPIFVKVLTRCASIANRIAFTAIIVTAVSDVRAGFRL